MKQTASAKRKLAGKFVTYGIVIAFYVIIQVLNGAGMVSPSIAGQLVPICAYVTMAVSLNLVVGFSGELSLGHAGYMSVGSFSGIVASMSLQQAIPNGIARLAVAMLVGAVCAGIAGVIVGVPVLRLQGDYLAIVTWPSARSSRTSSTSCMWAWTPRSCTSPSPTRLTCTWVRAVCPFSRVLWGPRPM